MVVVSANAKISRNEKRLRRSLHLKVVDLFIPMKFSDTLIRRGILI